MNGEYLPYLLRNDWLITTILFLCLILMSYFFSHGRKFLQYQLKNLIINKRRISLFEDSTNMYIRYTFVFILHSCIVFGLCIYNYFAETEARLFELFPHYLLLGIFIVGVMFIIALKFSLYSFVNWIFFSKEQNVLWKEFFFNVIIWAGFILLPIVLLVVYFELSLQVALYFIYMVIISIKLILFFRCFSNFFINFYGCFHLILYFCALEILPDILTWKSILLANNFFVQ